MKPAPFYSVPLFSFEKHNIARLAWNRLAYVPGGRLMFNNMIGLTVPYSGSIRARVIKLERGYCETELRDRRLVRNHLKSVHAIALANLAELTGNLGVLYSMPDDARIILAGLSMQYHCKARGTIVATASSPVFATSKTRTFEVPVNMHDRFGTCVATATLQTKIGPKRATC